MTDALDALRVPAAPADPDPAFAARCAPVWSARWAYPEEPQAP